MVERLRDRFEILSRWMVAQEYRGFDPYDVRGSDPFFRLVGGSGWLKRKARGLFSRVVEDRIDPVVLRRLMRVPPTINAKGIGLCLRSYAVTSGLVAHSRYDTEAAWCIEWLREHAWRDNSATGWGYPFHWDSRIPIPAGTPSVVVTGVVGDALLEYYLNTKDEGVLDLVDGVRDFILCQLKRSFDGAGNVCFSYTPIDDFRVHNASLFAGAFLSRYAKVFGKDELLDLAVSSAKYVASEQLPNGAFAYWSQEPKSMIDHYHTGFVLRHLTTINAASPTQEVAHSLASGLLFYEASLLDSRGRPKFTPESLFPIDVHSCAEALLMIAHIRGLTDDTLQTIDFVLNEMWNPETNHFYSAIADLGVRHTTPWIRWNVSWMMLAIAELWKLAGGQGKV